LKILIVSQYFAPENFPINGIVKSLVEKGVEVDILTGNPNYPEGRIYPGYRAVGCGRTSWHGIGVYRVPIFPRGARGALRLAMNYLSFVFFASLFGPWLLRSNRYDAVFVYAPSPILQAIPAIVLATIKRCKVAVWIQDLWPESLSATGYVANVRLVAMMRVVVRAIYARSDLLLVQSRGFQLSVAALANGRTIAYLPNAVEDMYFAEGPDQPLPAIEGLDAAFVVLFAGNIGAAQGVGVIVDAAKLLSPYEDIHFIVAGNGSKLAWLREETRAQSLTNLHLLGRLPATIMPTLMSKASALLVTLTADEIFSVTVPSKVQAYLASGRPILASLNGEGARLVEEAQAGLAVPAQDAKGLAEAVLRLYYMSDEERSRLGANGRRYCWENFRQEKVVGQLIGHLRALSAAEGEIQ
jgi:glycosyltransferase involved in cell wall biosynthesis